MGGYKMLKNIIHNIYETSFEEWLYTATIQEQDEAFSELVKAHNGDEDAAAKEWNTTVQQYGF